MKSVNKTKVFFLLGAVLSPMLAMAWNHCPPPPSAPIDGGLGLLLAAGVGYGVKRFASAKKNKAVEK